MCTASVTILFYAGGYPPWHPLYGAAAPKALTRKTKNPPSNHGRREHWILDKAAPYSGRTLLPWIHGFYFGWGVGQPLPPQGLEPPALNYIVSDCIFTFYPAFPWYISLLLRQCGIGGASTHQNLHICIVDHERDLTIPKSSRSVMRMY